MKLEFPESLPVSGRRDEIAAAIAAHPVVIVCGETGSGKTTQLPKICLAAGRGSRAIIGHTQPRRLAATAVARRIAEELGSPLGTDVGFKIRFSEKVSPRARIKLMTDGILLAESLSDPLLRAYDTILVDEAHERSLNIDFLLGYLKRLIEGPRREDLKLVITSATLDADRFARHFAVDGRAAPVIEVSGRLYPVEVRYRPLAAPAHEEDPDDETELPDAIEDAIDELWRGPPGDILVFLPGEREIREVAEHLRRAWLRRGQSASGLLAHAEILPLFSRLSVADQQRVFAPTGRPRVVLATNVAETSLTVPGIRYVIDSGLARVKRYRYRGKVEQLQIEPVSQAAARQRAGRCGRVAEGVCIRLYDEDDFNRRPAYTDPEVLRSSLAAVILRMKALRLPDIEQFPFVDPPPRKAIADGIDLLIELGALDGARDLTAVGRQLARLAVDPRLGRMLLAGRENGCLRELLIIVSALSVQDPRERPADRQKAADEKHQRFADPRSDFLAFVRLWDYWQAAVRDRPEGVSRRALSAQFEREFLSTRKLREWADVHGQLLETVIELHWKPNEEPAPFEAVHRAILSGLLGNLGHRSAEEPHYLGTHGTRFWLHPASTLSRPAATRSEAASSAGAARKTTPAGSGGRWVMAAEMVDTGRLYARTVARIDPVWIERLAGSLIRKSWSEPHWEKRAGQLVAFERGTLYGLVVYAQRRVHYASIDPALAREALIRHALVAGDWDSGCAFFRHNQRVIAEIEQLEHQIRRPDLLVDEHYLYDFFDAQVPAGITTGAALEKWYRAQSPGQPGLLELSREQLLRKDGHGVDHRNFPARLTLRTGDFELGYRFEPGHDDDGVTVTVPLHALNQLDPVALEWLVPGMRVEKIAVLLKSLPQRYRRSLVPLADWARGFVDRAAGHGWIGERGLLDSLIADLAETAGVRVRSDDFRLETVPPHLLMNIRLIDAEGRYLDASRQLSSLRARHAAAAQSRFRESVPVQAARIWTEWGFGELPELLELEVAGSRGPQRLVGYPALVDRGEGVELQVFDEPEEALRIHRVGLRRLFAVSLREPLRYFARNIPEFQSLAMLYMPFGTAEALRESLIECLLDRVCLTEPLPADRASFEARLAQARPRLTPVGQELARTLKAVMTEHAGLARKRAALKTHREAMADVDRQLQALLAPGFITTTPAERFAHLPRYLKAVSLRFDKLRADPLRDAHKMAEMAPLLHNLHRAQAALKGREDPRLQEFRWLLEELRVSLFAQELKTPMPVSVKRLQRVWESLQ